MDRGQLGGDSAEQEKLQSGFGRREQTAHQPIPPCSSVFLLGFYKVSSKTPSPLGKNTFQKSDVKAVSILVLYWEHFVGPAAEKSSHTG